MGSFETPQLTFVEHPIYTIGVVARDIKTRKFLDKNRIRGTDDERSAEMIVWGFLIGGSLAVLFRWLRNAMPSGCLMWGFIAFVVIGVIGIIGQAIEKALM
jgi:hypothetical protein